MRANSLNTLGFVSLSFVRLKEVAKLIAERFKGVEYFEGGYRWDCPSMNI